MALGGAQHTSVPPPFGCFCIGVLRISLSPLWVVSLGISPRQLLVLWLMVAEMLFLIHRWCTEKLHLPFTILTFLPTLYYPGLWSSQKAHIPVWGNHKIEKLQSKRIKVTVLHKNPLSYAVSVLFANRKPTYPHTHSQMCTHKSSLYQSLFPVSIIITLWVYTECPHCTNI